MKTTIKKLALISVFLVVSANIFTEEVQENGTKPKYSQRNDNFIEISALYSEESSKYQISDSDSVKIILETKNSDIASINIVINNIEKKMSGIGSYKGKEIFMIELPNEDMKYYFVLKDGNESYNYMLDNKLFEYTKKNNFTNIPDWSKSSVGYQIYIDSFRNGNIDNDPIFNEFGADDFLAPTGELRSGTKKSDLVFAQWSTNEEASEFTVNPWNSNYEKENSWEQNALNQVKDYTRYYGGDLQGINDKLDYLKDLGVEYIVLSPPFYSFSNHKYNAIYFNHIDPYFGNLEQTGANKGLDINAEVHNNNGDKELNLLIYNPEEGKNLLGETIDPKTWVWTDSDLELAALVKEAHKKGMKIILEVAPDITSNKFFANVDSKYSSWYKNKDDLRLDLSNKQMYDYLLNSMKKWILGPDALFKNYSDDDGIDGLKYVLYDNENKEALAKLTNELKKYKDDILVVGEDNRGINTDVELGLYDSGIDYNIANILGQYVVNTNSNYKINNVEFVTKLNEIYNKYSDERFKSSEIYLDSSDTDRVFSSIINPNRIYDRNNQSDQGYKNIRPDVYDPTAVLKMKELISIQLTMLGTPIIYYGDEKGMWGADSPRNRKPMLWEDYVPYENESDDIAKYTDRLRSFPENVTVNEVEKKIYYPVEINSDIENRYKKLLSIRKQYKSIFKNGQFRILEAYNDTATKERIDEFVSSKLADQKRKAKTYQGLDINPAKPKIDFITYEIYDGKKSIFVVVNNSSDSYSINALVPKLFGVYDDLLSDSKERYLISDRKIELYLAPYEVKILYSNDSGILDSL